MGGRLGKCDFASATGHDTVAMPCDRCVVPTRTETSTYPFETRRRRVRLKESEAARLRSFSENAALPS